MSEILRLEGIKKSYGSIKVLDIDRLSFESGTYNVILGPSGAGKTTLLRIVAGLEHPDSGRIYLEGRDITDKPPWERDIGLVFQNYALYPHLTVFDNIALPLTVKGVPKESIKEKVLEIVRILGIEEHLNKYPRQLSGGQQQRVALARAVIKEPKILLLDEPLSNLDAKVRVEVRGYLKALQRQLGITALHVTHDQLEAMAIADNIVILSQGAIEQTGSPKEVYENPRTLFVANFIGSFNVLSKEYFHLNLEADYVGFRPEAAEILLDETPDSIRGKVLYTEFQGSESIVHVQVDGNRIRIRDTKNLELAPGQEVYLKVRKMYIIKGERIVGSV